MIQSTGFIITYPGDQSVGIFEQQWQLSGDFQFESPVDLDVFKRKIAKAFEFCSDTPIVVESIEERSARINEELTAFPGAYHSA